MLDLQIAYFAIREIHAQICHISQPCGCFPKLLQAFCIIAGGFIDGSVGILKASIGHLMCLSRVIMSIRQLDERRNTYRHLSSAKLEREHQAVFYSFVDVSFLKSPN
jgi:hypothetical protein